MTNSTTDHVANEPVGDVGWEHDYDAINSAIKLLNINYPVYIERDPIAFRGQYCGMLEDAEHGLMHTLIVRQDLSPREASLVIWHELAHAAQCERTGGNHAYHAAYRAQIDDAGLDYDRFGSQNYLIENEDRIMSIPFEREAEATQRENGATLLARRVTHE